MGDCFSNRIPDEHNLENISDAIISNINQKNVNDISINSSFPSGHERKSLKNKAPIIDKRVEDSFTRDAPEAIIMQKLKLAEDLSLIYNSLNKHFIFKNLSKEQQDLIMQEMKFYAIPANVYVVEQGKPGNNFFVVASGAVEVLVNENNSIDLNF